MWVILEMFSQEDQCTTCSQRSGTLIVHCCTPAAIKAMISMRIVEESRIRPASEGGFHRRDLIRRDVAVIVCVMKQNRLRNLAGNANYA